MEKSLFCTCRDRKHLFWMNVVFQILSEIIAQLPFTQRKFFGAKKYFFKTLN
jgi:hypothetical protein